MRIFLCALIIFLTSCGQKTNVSSPQLESDHSFSKQHYYSLKEGNSYGYEKELTEHDRQSGVMAKSLVMFKYSGSKEGIHQVYSDDQLTKTLIVIECSDPCEFLKILTYYNGSESPIIERMRTAEGTIGFSVMSDAISGNLEPVYKVKDGIKHRIWLTDHGTMMEQPV